MNELNNKLDSLGLIMVSIDVTMRSINDKLDELIKALHEYDDDQLHCEYSGLPSVKAYSNEEYGESSFEAFQDETELNKRMDIIGQNGNEGSHYVTNEEADEDTKINNIQPKQKQYYKNNRSKRSDNKK